MIIYGPLHYTYDIDTGPVMLIDWYHQDYETIVRLLSTALTLTRISSKAKAIIRVRTPLTEQLVAMPVSPSFNLHLASGIN